MHFYLNLIFRLNIEMFGQLCKSSYDMHLIRKYLPHFEWNSSRLVAIHLHVICHLSLKMSRANIYIQRLKLSAYDKDLKKLLSSYLVINISLKCKYVCLFHCSFKLAYSTNLHILKVNFSNDFPVSKMRIDISLITS